MNTLEIVIGAVLIVVALISTVLVMFQPGDDNSMNAVTGASSDAYLNTNKGGRKVDEVLAHWTKFAMGAFFAVTLATWLAGIFF